MIYDKILLKVLLGPSVSEKSSIILEKYGTVLIKVARNSTKLEIKHAVQSLFNVVVSNINVLIVKGKRKKKNNVISREKNWKKAYVTLKKGQNLNFIGNKE
ncbi:MAG: 50S ribosomal protein L23 [Buchnera aphidicola (Chaetogeoica yunlongensis)]